MASEADIHQRHALPWPYVVILLAETTTLATLVALHGSHPPYAYEAGWIAVGSMIVMQIYSLRRRAHALRDAGALGAWLDVHIFLGLQGFVLVAYHAVAVSPNASLATFDYALVALIVFSGMIGRYVYTIIPRARANRSLEYAELSGLLRSAALPPEVRRECRGFRDLAKQSVVRRNVARDAPPLSPEHAAIRDRSIALAARISRLEVADRWLSRWTLFHGPVAFLLLCITILHVLAHFVYAT